MDNIERCVGTCVIIGFDQSRSFIVFQKILGKPFLNIFIKVVGVVLLFDPNKNFK